MKKIYEHQIAEGDHAECICVEAKEDSIRIAISDIINIDTEDEDEQITSVVLTQDRVMPLIDALLGSIGDENYVVLKFSNEQIETAIEALGLSLETLKNEANKGSVLLSVFNKLESRYSAILEEMKLYASVGSD